MRLGDSTFAYHKNRPVSAEGESPNGQHISKVNSRQVAMSKGQS